MAQHTTRHPAASPQATWSSPPPPQARSAPGCPSHQSPACCSLSGKTSQPEYVAGNKRTGRRPPGMTPSSWSLPRGRVAHTEPRGAGLSAPESERRVSGRPC